MLILALNNFIQASPADAMEQAKKIIADRAAAEVKAHQQAAVLSQAQAIEALDTIFLTKHLYWHVRKLHDLASNMDEKLGDTLGLKEYFKVIFWISFSVVMLLMIIVFWAALANTHDSYEFGGFWWIYLLCHFFYYAIIFAFSIFLANCGPVWYSVVGLIVAVIMGFELYELNLETILPICETLNKYSTTKKKYKGIYNKIKTQSVWNQQQ